MPEFSHTDLLPTGADGTEYRRLDAGGVTSRESFGTFIEIDPGALTLLTREAMRDIAHLLRPAHLGQLRSILDDGEASPNDRYVALGLLRNACTAAGGVLPMCQDTGTAIIMAKRVLTDGRDEEHIARGVYDACTQLNLRYSQLAPLGQQVVPVPADEGGTERGEHARLPRGEDPLAGHRGLPAYHLAIVVGGTSAEYALKTAKHASARYLDTLPLAGSPTPGWSSRCWRSPAAPGSAPSSAASTSATTCG